jgi:hypothetical protein
MPPPAPPAENAGQDDKEQHNCPENERNGNAALML